ncbi:MAG: nuclear transport factor 2 family protein [Bordetella sp.]|nr:nuclear transport factor 2 family protein [Pseudomonadota bacterium]
MAASEPAPHEELAARITSLVARVERLESLEAIRTLRARYHELVNEDEGARLYELFAPDATVAYNGRPEVRGREAIRRFFETFPVQHARQFMHQHEIRWEGDRATGHCYLDGRPVSQGRSLYVVGRFDDEYVRLDGRWLFQRVVLTVHYMIEAAERWDHLLPVRKAQVPR